MNPLFIKIGSAVVSLIAAFAVGWLVHGWKYDAEQLAVETAKEAAFKVALDKVQVISDKLQTTTDALEKKRMVTTREVINETTKVEYRCVLPEPGRLLYNAAAAESAAPQ